MSQMLPNDLYRHLANLQEHPFDVDDSYFHFNFSKTVMHVMDEADLDTRDNVYDLLEHWSNCLNLLDDKFNQVIQSEQTEENRRYRSCVFMIRLKMMKRYHDILIRHQFIILENTLGELIFTKSIRPRLLDQDIRKYWIKLFRILTNYNANEEEILRWVKRNITSLPDSFVERFYLYFSFLLEVIKDQKILVPNRLTYIIEEVLIAINTHYYSNQPEGRIDHQKKVYQVKDPQLGSLSLTVKSIKLNYIPVKSTKDKVIPAFLTDYKMKPPMINKLSLDKPVKKIPIRIKKKRTYEVPSSC